MQKTLKKRNNNNNKKKKTIKNVPWRGWKNVKPSVHGRTVMQEKCGKKCFLGPDKSFPICDMNTCKVDRRGIWAAYIRAKEWESRSRKLRKQHAPHQVRHKYTKIARKAKQMLNSKNRGGGIIDYVKSFLPLNNGEEKKDGVPPAPAPAPAQAQAQAQAPAPAPGPAPAQANNI
jgi:hypothetical protein